MDRMGHDEDHLYPDALPYGLVRKLITRLLARGHIDTALGVYLTHVEWRKGRGLPFLPPEEVGISYRGIGEEEEGF